ncbi:MAG: hypothetical protein Q7J86_15875, partial [Bacteroidota bacterium]|nr:hypothetical protein [Bacteroidota bacterium]
PIITTTPGRLKAVVREPKITAGNRIHSQHYLIKSQNLKIMTWLWVILVVAAIGGIISYLSSGKAEDGVAGAATAGIGCAVVIFQIFLALAGFLIFLKIASWLFG